jgi:hypothetical protein
MKKLSKPFQYLVVFWAVLTIALVIAASVVRIFFFPEHLILLLALSLIGLCTLAAFILFYAIGVNRAVKITGYTYK